MMIRYEAIVVGIVYLWLTPCLLTADDVLRTRAQESLGSVSEVDSAVIESSLAQLGRALFWDRAISASGTISCADCHLASDGGADRRPFSVDARGKLTKRNSQTVFHAALQPALRWTADRASAAEQAQRSLTGSMGFDSPEAALVALREAGYEPRFREAFSGQEDPLSTARYGEAIAAYEKTLITPAPFDRFLAGDDSALSEQQLRGLEAFLNRCADCHDGPLLGGNRLERLGIAEGYAVASGSEHVDEGRFEVTKLEEDRGRFRISMLRNIGRTGPYFHDGAVETLAEAVQVMARTQLGEQLEDEEVKAIVAFLKSLDGQTPEHYAPPRRENQKEP